MHARIDQLLSLRDQAPVDAAVARHVADCPACTAELHRLRGLQERLQELPMLAAPTESWQRIQDEMSRRRVQGARMRGAGLVAGVVICAAAVIALYDGSSPQHAHTSAPAPSAAGQHAVLADLVAQSRVLDEALQTLPRRPAVERVSTAATIDTIEERIQWLDFHLSYAPVELDDAQAQRLWSERIELMDSLVKIRYAEARRTSF